MRLIIVIASYSQGILLWVPLVWNEEGTVKPICTKTIAAAIHPTRLTSAEILGRE